MALSWSEEVVPAGTALIPVNIEYLDKSYIHVYINNVLLSTANYSWSSDALIQLSQPLSATSTVSLVRRTDKTQLYIMFAEGAAFIKENLDTQNTQFLHLTQELVEGRSIEGFYGDISMNGYRITSLGDGINPGDAVNKKQLDEVDQRVSNIESSFVTSTTSYPFFELVQTTKDTFSPPFVFDKAAVYINGLCQAPGYSYVVVDNQILLAEPVPAGTAFLARLGEDVTDEDGYATVQQLLNLAELFKNDAERAESAADRAESAADAAEEYALHLPFGSATEGVYYRPGVNYESAGTVAKNETRPWYHDFRPLGVEQGGDALFSTDGANMFFGPGAGNFTMRPVALADLPAGKDYNLQCSHNIALGVQALSSLTIGYKNSAFGTNALRKLTSGHGNTATGRDCGHELTTGNENTFYGFTAAQLMQTGNYNCVFGVSASYNNLDGTGNTVYGRRAAFNQSSGNYNQFFGEQAGLGLVSGSYNTFIGKQVSSTGLANGDSNTIIGSRISGLQDEKEQVVIADGNGKATLEVHKDPTAAVKKATKLNLPSYNTTAFEPTATDGQPDAGSTVFLENLANVGNAICQIIAKSRAGAAVSRIVNSGGNSGFWSFIVAGKECLRMDASGNVLVRGGGGGSLGYATGAGGSVSPAVRGDAVTLDKPTGRITLPAGSMTAGQVISFTLNNALIAAADNLVISSSATTGVYFVQATKVEAGSARISVFAPVATSAESISINFSIIKGATA